MHKKGESGHIAGPEGLACAVVEQAARDYRSALETLREEPDNMDAKQMKEDCERFFRGEMKSYLDMDGEAVIRAIKERADEGS